MDGETNPIVSFPSFPTFVSHFARTTIPILSTYNVKNIKVSEDIEKYNDAHPLILRLDAESFLLRMLDDPRLSNTFASLANTYDKTSFGWAVWDEEQGRVIYQPNCVPATLAEFWVLDHQINPGEIVCPGHRQVLQSWHDDMVEGQQRRLANHKKRVQTSREEKRVYRGLPDIDSPATRAALAKRMAIDDAETKKNLRAAAKKARLAGPLAAPAPLTAEAVAALPTVRLPIRQHEAGSSSGPMGPPRSSCAESVATEAGEVTMRYTPSETDFLAKSDAEADAEVAQLAAEIAAKRTGGDVEMEAE
ncbi:hypothetical protein B0H13DRAFT_2342070 [Mycena leptocephala]|nr:hypothetical protein B0H13DRAFT_2342070 [Mycena leptocephala]